MQWLCRRGDAFTLVVGIAGSGKNSFISPVDFRKKSVIIISRQAGVAQLVEQLTCNQQVISPNLIAGSITLRD